MESKTVIRPLILAVSLVVAAITSYEMYWRGRGFTPTFNDDKILWSTKRNELKSLTGPSTVFIGGSRIKFDLDISTWEKLTGEKAIQLAIVATPARRILKHLASDNSFSGKLIIDVAEPQFFTLDSIRRDRFAIDALEYYREETPTQRSSAHINYFLESNLVCLEESKFGLTSLLNDLAFPNRPGVFSLPPFPKEFSVSNFDRQTFLTQMFLDEPALQQWQINNWKSIGVMNAAPAIKGETLVAFLNQFKTAIDRIRARGGQIIFVRPPSSGGFWEMEQKNYPRNQYWDVLLEYTNTPGIHFSDYEETAHFVCPEWSHLSPTDAAAYTEQLVRILREQQGWKFQKDGTTTTLN